MAGLPTCLEFEHMMGLNKAIENQLKIRSGCLGWSHPETVMPPISLNLPEAQGMSDFDVFQRDEGFCRVLRSFRFRRSICEQ
jgi:hypothetical protein